MGVLARRSRVQPIQLPRDSKARFIEVDDLGFLPAGYRDRLEWRSMGVTALQNVPPTPQGFTEHKKAGGARPLVLIVYPTRMLARPGNGYARFLQQLDRLLIHAEHGIARIIEPGVDVEYFLHTGGEFGIGIRRNHPIGDLPRGEVIFFSVLRSVSWLTVSTMSNVMACSASRRRVQLANPGGGGPSRKAMIWAS